MDLQEKLNETVKKIKLMEEALITYKADLKEHKKREKQYKSLIEKAKALENGK